MTVCIEVFSDNLLLQPPMGFLSDVRWASACAGIVLLLSSAVSHSRGSFAEVAASTVLGRKVTLRGVTSSSVNVSWLS